MANTRIGKLPPRYSLLLNSHAEVRLSKCPKCQKVTHLRKFALFVHIDEWVPMALGKTCRYCSRCEMVMVQRAELEAELARGVSQRAPQVIGNDYLVLGTMEKKMWREGLDGEAKPLAEMLKHVADFKHQYELDYKPGGWYPATQGPKRT
jgi:Zn-finger nucleic acid-binding protein